MPRSYSAIVAKEIMGLIRNAALSASRASETFDLLKAQVEATSQAMGRVGEMYAALISSAQSTENIDEGLAEARVQVRRTDASFADLRQIFAAASQMMDAAVVELATAKASWRALQN